jgi:hypothetical protein
MLLTDRRKMHRNELVDESSRYQHLVIPVHYPHGSDANNAASKRDSHASRPTRVSRLRVHRREPEARRPVPVRGRERLHDLDPLVLAREAVRPHPRLPLEVHGEVHRVGPQRGALCGGRGHGARRVHEHRSVADVLRLLPRLAALVQHAHHEPLPARRRHGAEQLHLHQLAAGGRHQEAALHVRARAPRHGGDDLGGRRPQPVELREHVHHPVPRVGVELAPVDHHVDHGGDAGRRHGLPRAVARTRRGPLVAVVQLPVDGEHHDPAARGGHRDGLLDQGVHGGDAAAAVVDLEALDAGDERERGDGRERPSHASYGVEQVHLAEVVRGHDSAARGAEWHEPARGHAAEARGEGGHGDLAVAAHEQAAVVVVGGDICGEEQPWSVGLRLAAAGGEGGDGGAPGGADGAEAEEVEGREAHDDEVEQVLVEPRPVRHGDRA